MITTDLNQIISEFPTKGLNILDISQILWDTN